MRKLLKKIFALSLLINLSIIAEQNIIQCKNVENSCALNSLGQEEIKRGRKNCKAFCNLQVKNKLTANDVTIAGNLCLDGVLVNPRCIGCTGPTGPAIIPTNRLVSGTISLTPNAALTFSSVGVDLPIIVNGTPPTATAAVGTGFSVGAVTPIGFSSGFVTDNSREVSTGNQAGFGFYIIIGFQIPITFTPAYSGVPTIVSTLQSPNTLIGSALLLSLNTGSFIDTQITHVTAGSAVLNLQIHMLTQGVPHTIISSAYTTALNLASTILNDLLANGHLSINFISNGPA